QHQVGDLRTAVGQVDIQVLLQMHRYRIGGDTGHFRIDRQRLEYIVVGGQVGAQSGLQVQVHADVILILIAQRHLQRERLFEVHVLGIEVEMLDTDIGAVGGVLIAHLAVGDGDDGDGQRNVHA